MIREALAAALMFSQGMPGATGGASGTGPVSPSVIATDMYAIDAEGNRTLELLVLWRGSAGWFRRGNGGSSGSSLGGGAASPERRDVRAMWLSQGGVELRLQFEPSARKVWVQDQEIDLSDSNVILVDEVDAAAGPRVVGVLRIDPGRLGNRPEPLPVQNLIRRSQELIDFLRCDVRLPDASPYEAQAFGAMCAALIHP